jgi:Protein of unknown function (DUF3551)
MNSIRNLDGRVNRFRASQRAANPLAVSAARIALRISNLLKAFDALAIPFHQRQGGNADRSQPPIPKEILMRISGFGNSRNRSDFGGSSGTGPDIRRGISGLPALTCIANPYFVGETEPQSAGCLSAATSLPQCNASASGRSAQCVVNPYWANAYQDRPIRRRGVY